MSIAPTSSVGVGFNFSDPNSTVTTPTGVKAPVQGNDQNDANKVHHGRHHHGHGHHKKVDGQADKSNQSSPDQQQVSSSNVSNSPSNNDPQTLIDLIA